MAAASILIPSPLVPLHIVSQPREMLREAPAIKPLHRAAKRVCICSCFSAELIPFQPIVVFSLPDGNNPDDKLQGDSSAACRSARRRLEFDNDECPAA